MQDPRRDITEVVKRLTVTSSPDVQLKTLQTYFTEDAAFDHPLCRVDPGHNSREKILEIYQWYKITSPKIELNVEEIGAISV
ncbi:hypothetical protein FRB99_008962 [Tulasnella sp. 403]|nr:hypothetical protein FRB99_008962 [Tulasnella sp. 403]